MKVIIVGGHGAIGRRVVNTLSKEHDIVTASRSKGNVNVDLVDIESIRDLYETVGEFDAVICIAGEAKWAPMKEMTEGDYYMGIRSKLMGQMNLVRLGMEYIQPNGSFTLTTGVLADHPVHLTTSAAMVNGGIHSFVKAAALEMERGVRINAVSSGLVEDAFEKYKEYFPGHNPMPMERVVNGYVKCLEGWDNGNILRIYDDH